MNVSRVLHPIGQGSFYTESFTYNERKCNVIFDCGGTRGYIEDEVRDYCHCLVCQQQTKYQKPVVDALFISHFDDDHVNGLETLFNNARVLRIFLPLLNDGEIWTISPSFVNNLRNPLYQNLLNAAIHGIPLEWEGQSIKVVRINKNNAVSVRDELFLEDGINGRQPNVIASGSPVFAFHGCPWIFRTFNYDNADSSRFGQLMNALTSKSYKLSLTELVSCWSDQQYQDDIRACYHAVRGTINGNSMVTYSGPNGNGVSAECYFIDGPFGCFLNGFAYQRAFHIYPNLAGCMYFGDYEAAGSRKWKQYEDDFKNQIHLLQMQQVPHHGSQYNYNDALNSPAIKFNFISAGKSNRFHHPHNVVLNELNNICAPWVWIHEFSPHVVMNYEITF